MSVTFVCDCVCYRDPLEAVARREVPARREREA